jgi:hypothetical protein
MALIQAMNRDAGGQSVSSISISPEVNGIIILIVGIFFLGTILYFLVGLLNEKIKYYKLKGEKVSQEIEDKEELKNKS